MNFFDPTLIYLIFDVESIGDGPRVPRAHLEVVLTQLLAARAPTLYADARNSRVLPYSPRASCRQRPEALD